MMLIQLAQIRINEMINQDQEYPIILKRLNKKCYNYTIKLVRQEAMLCIANELPLPFGVILPGCAFVVMQRCKAPGTM